MKKNNQFNRINAWGRFLWIATVCLMMTNAGVLEIAHSVYAQTEDEQKAFIEKGAQERRREPVDARIDPIWKGIPELNGIEVDVEATLRKTRKKSLDPSEWEYRQIPAKIKLEDLPPAPIYHGNPQKKQMALMVNVAWGTENIPEILELFKKYGVKSTFFLDGSWLQKNGDVAKTIVAAGHEIGNHAYSHPDMARISQSKVADQIDRTNRAISDSLGITCKLFAPPSGSYNDYVVKAASERGMRTILWTLDTVDWKRPPSGTIIRRILPKAQNGAMVLMHPTEPTVGALRTLIPELQKKGYDLVAVSELLSSVRPIEK